MKISLLAGDVIKCGNKYNPPPTRRPLGASYSHGWIFDEIIMIIMLPTNRGRQGRKEAIYEK